MEFSGTELIAIGALILNIIVYFSRVPTRKDLNDLRIELRSEIGNLRNELHSEIGGVRNEIGSVRNEIGDLRIELRSEIGNLRSEIGDLRSEINVRFSKLEEAFTNHLMFMHGDSRQPPTQDETE